ncbi:hypothetical protein [Actinomadura sp. CNU-125]|uniref:hypothetical protein n=1 Tax=Actinomadura sp. CNU-125 TaxID=1904961 RepID=UPI0021CC7C9F|nr:hypothetical protein [Actinomadura sp. CNU-125]
MAESTMTKMKDDLVGSPAADRLKNELQSYVQARALQAVSGLGERIGQGAGKLARAARPAGWSAGSPRADRPSARVSRPAGPP